MKKIVSALVLLFCIASCGRPVNLGIHDRPAHQSSAITSSPYVIATDFTGTDLGAQINSASDSLGSIPGTIVIPAGRTLAENTITTQIVLPSNRSLHFGAGYYTVNTPGTPATGGAGCLIFVGDNVDISGDGWDTVIEQPSSLCVVSPQAEATILGDLPGSKNVTIRNLQLVTPNTPMTSTGGSTALGLGNSSHVSISNVFFNGTWGIDIALGGTSNPVSGTSYHCDSVTVSGCHHHRTTDDAIKVAVVNCSNFSVTGNLYDNGSSIDLEPNIVSDVSSGWVVANNTFKDGGTIEVQYVTKNGAISGNTFMGNGLGSTAINLVGTSNVLVSSNVIDGYNGADSIESSGIVVGSSTDIRVVNNIVTNTSLVSGYSPNIWNATPIAVTGSSLRTVISGNYVSSPTHGWSGFREDATASQTFVSGNYFGTGSVAGVQPDVSISGLGSKAWDNVFVDRRASWHSSMRPYRRITSSSSLSADDDIVGVDPSGSPSGLALQLPDPASMVYSDLRTIRSVNAVTVTDEAGCAATHPITLVRFGTENINGVPANYSFTTSGGSFSVYTNGTDWFIR